MTTLAEIFVNLQAHIEAGKFIQENSTNKEDIRDFTFRDTDLTQCKNILDLGCSYGFFTRGLAGRLHPNAHLVGIDLWAECAKHFVNACRESGYSGEFVLSDAGMCKRLPDASFDLVLCSYSLYFFPHAIPDIARILKQNGFFIAVTHAIPHMPELVDIAKKLIQAHTGHAVHSLPLETLFEEFSSVNGTKMLSPWFRKIKEKKYVNSLQITHAALSGLTNYLCFKRPKFFVRDIGLAEEFIKLDLVDYFEELLSRQGSVTITKDDVVYICQHPKREAQL